MCAREIGIRRFDVGAAHAPELSRHGTDDILWGIHRHTDDVDIFLSVRQPHTSDDVPAVQVQNVVDFFRVGVIF